MQSYIQVQTKTIATEFLRNLIKAVLIEINKILTDTGIQFTNHERHIHAFIHIFDLVCNKINVEPRSPKVKHPWTSGTHEYDYKISYH
jgi:hypothetical protein